LLIFLETKSIDASKEEDFKDVLKIDEELEKKEKVIIGSPIKKNNYATNPNDLVVLSNENLNESTEKLDLNENEKNENKNANKEKNILVHSMKIKNKHNDFINFSIDYINKSKKIEKNLYLFFL